MVDYTNAVAMIVKDLVKIMTVILAIVAFGNFGAFGVPASYDADAAAVRALTGLFGLGKPIANDSFYSPAGNPVFLAAQNMETHCMIFGAFMFILGLVGAGIVLLPILLGLKGSIAAARREIGVLRSLGVGVPCLFGIFFAGSLVLALICALPAMGVAAVVCLLIDMTFAAPLHLLYFKIIGALVVLGISPAAFAAGSFLPALIAAAKAPVKTIRPLR